MRAVHVVRKLPPEKSPSALMRRCRDHPRALAPDKTRLTPVRSDVTSRFHAPAAARWASPARPPREPPSIARALSSRASMRSRSSLFRSAWPQSSTASRIFPSQVPRPPPALRRATSSGPYPRTTPRQPQFQHTRAIPPLALRPCRLARPLTAQLPAFSAVPQPSRSGALSPR